MAHDRNVVLVTIDSLRADHCGFMGYRRETTPTLDRLASDGLVFENAIAFGPSTLDSMPSVFTGSHSADHSPDTAPTTRLRKHIGTSESVAETFSRMGYETIGFTANPWTSRYTGFDRGFDFFEDFMDVDRSSRFVEEKLEGGGSVASQAAHHLLSWTRERNMFQSWDAFYDQIRSAVERASEPYFLWVFLVDPHMPYLASDKYRSQSRIETNLANLWLFLESDSFESAMRDRLVTAYDDSIRYTDAFVDRITRDLADDDPVFVFHSDHGEGFGERDGAYGHGESLHEEQIHVPLVVANGPTDTVERPFSLRSLPTLLTRLATGGDYRSLTEPFVRSQLGTIKALRGAEWKYVDGRDGERLYELPGDDRTQMHDPELRDLCRRLVADWREDERERLRVADAAEEIAATHGI